MKVWQLVDRKFKGSLGWTRGGTIQDRSGCRAEGDEHAKETAEDVDDESNERDQNPDGLLLNALEQL